MIEYQHHYQFNYHLKQFKIDFIIIQTFKNLFKIKNNKFCISKLTF